MITTKQTGCPVCRTGIFGHSIDIINGKTFRSIRESRSYQILLIYFDEFDIQCQKRYNSDTRHTCDFYIPSKSWWIEIGNIKSKQYLQTLEKKESWIKEKGETWLQFDSDKELHQFLENKNE